MYAGHTLDDGRLLKGLSSQRIRFIYSCGFSNWQIMCVCGLSGMSLFRGKFMSGPLGICLMYVYT